MRILVVDDDQGLSGILKNLLVHHRHEVDCTDNAADAVALFKAGSYDFILLDYMLRGSDGIWFMENSGVTRKTKVLLITAYVNRTVINRMFSLGASGYLIKPFEEDDLLRHLDYFSR